MLWSEKLVCFEFFEKDMKYEKAKSMDDYDDKSIKSMQFLF